MFIGRKLRLCKGLFLRDVRDNVPQKVPQDITRRRVKIVIYLLRVGHVGLGAYLNRFNMKNSNLCKECKVSETVDHFLLKFFAAECMPRKELNWCRD